MAWQTGRRDQLPPDWRRRRLLVKARAHGRCEWIDRGTRCMTEGSDCDHRIRGNDHSLANLQWLCRPHHDLKTRREARDSRVARAHRPVEPPPGLIL